MWGDKCIQHSCCGVCDLVIKRNTLGQAAGYLTYSIPLSTMGATICRAHMPLLWTLTIDCTKNVMAEWTEERVDGAIHSRALWSTCKRGAAGRTRRRTTRRKKNATTTNAATTTTMVEKSRHLFLGLSTWRASCCRALLAKNKGAKGPPCVCPTIAALSYPRRWVQVYVCVEIKSSGRTHLQKGWLASHV